MEPNKNEDTITSSIPTRSDEPADEEMPDSAPRSNVADYERAQVPTQRSDIVTSDR